MATITTKEELKDKNDKSRFGEDYQVNMGLNIVSLLPGMAAGKLAKISTIAKDVELANDIKIGGAILSHGPSVASAISSVTDWFK